MPCRGVEGISPANLEKSKIPVCPKSGPLALDPVVAVLLRLPFLNERHQVSGYLACRGRTDPDRGARAGCFWVATLPEFRNNSSTLVQTQFSTSTSSTRSLLSRQQSFGRFAFRSHHHAPASPAATWASKYFLKKTFNSGENWLALPVLPTQLPTRVDPGKVPS